MVVVRPASMKDLDGLVELAGLAGVGLTTLPKDSELPEEMVRSFDETLGRMSPSPSMKKLPELLKLTVPPTNDIAPVEVMAPPERLCVPPVKLTAPAPLKVPPV